MRFSPKSYVLLTLTLCGAWMVFLVTMAWDEQPITGSLTRMGGFSERDFGINRKQTTFEKPLFKFSHSLEDYDRPADILVIGDSFSWNEKTSWLNHLLQEHPQSALNLAHESVAMGDIFEHPMFRESPPRHVILEFGESIAYLSVMRLGDPDALDNLPVPPTAHMQGAISQQFWDPGRKPVMLAEERETQLSLDEAISVSSNRVVKGLQRWLLGKFAVDAVALPLDCSECVSSRVDNQLLVRASSLEKGSNKLHLAADAVARLEKFKQKIEANGYTQVHTVIFPEKATAYADVAAVPKVFSIFDDTLLNAEIGLINLLGPFQQAISDGVPDVYLNSDHHTSDNGYKLAAREIGARLFGAGDGDIATSKVMAEGPIESQARRDAITRRGVSTETRGETPSMTPAPDI